MVSEPDTGWCASEDPGSERRVDCEILLRLEREERVPARTLGPERGGL